VLAILLEQGDTVALPPNVPHSFRVVGDQVLRTVGTHASPKRIAVYKEVSCSLRIDSTHKP